MAVEKLKLKVTKKGLNIVTEIREGTLSQLNKVCEYEKDLFAIVKITKRKKTKNIKIFRKSTESTDSFRNIVRLMTEYELQRVNEHNVEIIYYEFVESSITV